MSWNTRWNKEIMNQSLWYQGALNQPLNGRRDHEQSPIALGQRDDEPETMNRSAKESWTRDCKSIYPQRDPKLDSLATQTRGTCSTLFTGKDKGIMHHSIYRQRDHVLVTLQTLRDHEAVTVQRDHIPVALKTKAKVSWTRWRYHEPGEGILNLWKGPWTSHSTNTKGSWTRWRDHEPVTL